MRVGDFAHEGATNISVIDTDSYWIDGHPTKVRPRVSGRAQGLSGHAARDGHDEREGGIDPLLGRALRW